MPILSPRQRAIYLEFVGKHAGDDIVIAASLRTMYNIQESAELDKFIASHGRNPRIDAMVEKALYGEEKPKAVEIDNPEDLGTPAKKLGANGQAIHDLMKKETNDWTVEGLKARLKLPVTKVKPMLALLLERGLIKRISNHTYAVV